MTSWVTGVPPVSANVVGRRRIGKSSLLYHFVQTYEQRIPQPNNRFIVVYLSLQNAHCQQEEGFYRAVGQQFWSCPMVQTEPALADPLCARPFNRLAFSSAMGHWKRHGMLAVVFLDEFEVLMRHHQEFNEGFFDNLRSLMDSGALMLVVASLRKLDFYRRRYQLTSSFFKMGQVLVLGELKEEEATQLVGLPAVGSNNDQAALSLEEQKLVRQLGGTHPFLLQLAASFLWEARHSGRDVSWAKARFEAQARCVPGYSLNPRRWGYPLQVLVWLPLNLGRRVRGIRGTVDEIGNLMTGITILIAIILVLLVVFNLLK